MQTKNINVNRESNTNEKDGDTTSAEKIFSGIEFTVRSNLSISDDAQLLDAPPLPPRTALIFTPLTASYKQIEVEGYGPYKPVPPPKPLQQNQQDQQQQQQDHFTPPPYRMPPYPLYSEPSMPGTAGLDQPLAASSPATPQGLHTHSSKFPIEREVILSNTDKNSKIPILHDYMKRNKGSVAPDVPPKQMAAWTQGQMQNMQILPDQTHTGLIQTIQPSEPNAAGYRPSYVQVQVQEYYNGGQAVVGSTGAVPRMRPQAGDPTKPAPRPFQADEVAVQVETQKDQKGGGGGGGSAGSGKTMTKTYHTIKDMISSRFKANKESDERVEEAGLNNVAEELRKSQANIVAAEETEKKVSCEQVYTKQHQQYAAQQFIQQQMLVQQHQHQQYQQQLKTQHQQQYSQLAQARSHEMLTPRPDEQVYYQGGYVGSPQRNVGRYQGASREGNFVGVQQMTLEDRRQLQSVAERRSAQQLERDNQRQRSFEARRAASQPQLALDDDPKTDPGQNRPQPQMPIPVRRGSHGNIMETAAVVDVEKDSDDGGFLRRVGSNERRLEGGEQPKEGKSNEQVDADERDEPRSSDTMLGTPRKKLEGEIGKIEGVYNIGQRTNAKAEDEPKSGKKTNPGSATSSDYDKAGGQSSSNVDSGRGSAAYSSGRKPGSTDVEQFHSCQTSRGGKYRNSHEDPEWVDIVESELRHILEPKLHELSLQTNLGVANSTLSESISSMTPPLPPLSPGDQSSPNMTPRNSNRYKHSSLPYGSKPEYEGFKSKGHSRDVPGSSRWTNGSSQKHRSQKKTDHIAILRGKQIFGLDTTDLTSTTTRSMDLESILDAQSDSEGELSTADARTIRKQLEGLETMYSEVLKLLGVKRQHPGRYQPSDPRFSKRRYGSMSSLPSSSVSSRPVRDKRRANEDRKKVRDIRGINKRFQRLESHVVTLARSVAHLSSEMRTQHLMIQEMENIRGEIAALRAQTNMLNVRSQSATRAVSSRELPTLANPTRVKKLTKFFGDEPPLLRLFLKKLGYEKYAALFESERIGMVELPYLSEERLQKMGVPLGPRLRIMQEAQISVCKDNTLCIV